VTTSRDVKWCRHKVEAELVIYREEY